MLSIITIAVAIRRLYVAVGGLFTAADAMQGVYAVRGLARNGAEVAALARHGMADGPGPRVSRHTQTWTHGKIFHEDTLKGAVVDPDPRIRTSWF
jgi:hypothetical protein